MFLLEPKYPYGPASSMANSTPTVFHRLAMVVEGIRDNDLNQRVAGYLCRKFPQGEWLDKLNLTNNTAIALAAKNGNFGLVIELLRAGADSAKGRISAIGWITDRILHPDNFGGSFAGISRRMHQKKRYEDNSVHTLMALLEYDKSLPSRFTELERRIRLYTLVEHWRRDGYEDHVINEVLSM